MTETSALDALIRSHRGDLEANRAAFLEDYYAALQSDWDRGQAEEIAEYDCQYGVSGGIIRSQGYQGYVGTLRADGTPLTEFRSIPRNTGSTFREVFAKDVDGKVWYVGKLRRYEAPRTTATAQAELDRILALPGPVHVGGWKGD